MKMFAVLDYLSIKLKPTLFSGKFNSASTLVFIPFIDSFRRYIVVLGATTGGIGPLGCIFISSLI